MALLGTAACAGAARADEPRPSGRVVYESDQSIFTVNADGSDRTRLTHGTPFEGPVSDDAPIWSPDGSTIVFVRTTYAPPFWDPEPVDSDLYAIAPDGTGKRRLFPDADPDVEYYGAAFRPNGRLVVARRRDGDPQRQLVETDLDGGNQRVLLRTRRPVSGLGLSPDGERVLFSESGTDEDEYTITSDLWVMKIKPKAARLLARDASGGRWSPDGRRIAFVSTRDHNGGSCPGDYCYPNGEIYTMDVRGFHYRRLTHSTADDQAPSWSGDGSRVAFHSNRNYPVVEPTDYNTEVYSVTPTGGCLSWLTNGSRNSRVPEWQPDPGADPAPRSCGDQGLRAVVDSDFRMARHFEPAPLLWLGSRFREGIIASDSFVQPRYHVQLFYTDCEYFQRARCGKELLGLDEEPVCRGAASLLHEKHPGSSLYRRRGALVHKYSWPDADVYAGPTVVEIDADTRAGRDTVLRRLRPFPGKSLPAGLPEPVLPKSFWRELKRDKYEPLRDRLKELGVDGRVADCAAPE